MMKRKLILSLAVLGLFGMADVAEAQNVAVSNEEMMKAVSQAVMQQVAEMARQMRPIYEKLKTCTSAENGYLEIYGLENQRCHFKYVNYDCYVPLDVAAKYADASIKSLDEILSGQADLSKDNIQARYAEEVLFNKSYCRQDKKSAGLERLK